jgi:hypothetical protein
MASDSGLIQAVEQLGYRVTVGDVAAQAGIQVGVAQRALMALAADVGAHMQVAESGDIAYLFPPNFRQILADKAARQQWQETWAKIWAVLFYCVRISFGIFLILSVVMITVAILFVLLAGSASQGSSKSRDGDEDISGELSGALSSIGWGFSPDFLWYLLPGQRDPAVRHRPGQSINFLEAVFSFMFGDGNPNANLAKRGWQQLGALIRQNRGVVIAEQIVPYLVVPPARLRVEGTDENHVLPVLVQFNGVPQVSDTGDIVYQFPDLQTTAGDTPQRRPPQSQTQLPPALEEKLWLFSRASSTQVLWAIGLGLVNIVGALVLRELIVNHEVFGFLGLMRSILWLLLTYGIGFLAIPAVRYGLLLDRNQKIAERNFQRQHLATDLENQLATFPDLARKLQFAQQFSQQNYLDESDLAYTTETDLAEQEAHQKAKIDAEWQRRLERGDSR